MNPKSTRKSGARTKVKSNLHRSAESAPDFTPTTPVKKNPIHSVITALPVIMLVAGLWFYYSGEKKQRGGEPVLSEMMVVDGVFSGISEQNAKPAAQRILWIQTPDRLRGGRLDLAQYKQLQSLEKNQSLKSWMAPRVQGSTTLWVLKVVTDGKVIFDQINE